MFQLTSETLSDLYTIAGPRCRTRRRSSGRAPGLQCIKFCNARAINVDALIEEEGVREAVEGPEGSDWELDAVVRVSSLLSSLF